MDVPKSKEGAKWAISPLFHNKLWPQGLSGWSSASATFQHMVKFLFEIWGHNHNKKYKDGSQMDLGNSKRFFFVYLDTRK